MQHRRWMREWSEDVGATSRGHRANSTVDDAIAAAIWELGMAMRMVVATPSIGLPIAIAHGRERLRCIEEGEVAKGDARSAVLLDAYCLLLEALDELSGYITTSAVDGARQERHRIIEILANLADAAASDPTIITSRSALLDMTDDARAPVPRGMIPTNPLTQREQQVLELLATGADNREIASFLTISQKTAKKHVCNLMEKLGVSDRLKAVVKGLELGLVRAS